ncbi:response regulator [Saccharicrinis aurantiacus]|uniref:response regulator n=1 Tax=Saccharicrinis aurantiacus TaxID=1849719 RepID=UPI00094FDB7B|nr:response regulator [Saccharicrinis aurantiacus]
MLLSPQKILIIDDSKANILMLGEALSDYKCVAATKGENGIRIAKGIKKPDLILLDVVMPGIDGYEVCRRLKADEETKNIPIIFLSAATDSNSLVKGFSSGGVDFITKPFNFEELRIRVSTQLRLKKSLDDNTRYLKSIEEIYSTITDSIFYAQRIQEASLPSNLHLKETLGEDFFIVYKPRDIVSGDFYITHRTEDKTIIVAADCTGHGVPGALMSMLGMVFFREAIRFENLTTPSVILDRVRNAIINTLANNTENEVQDGMDASVVCINHSENTMEFAGANLPVYIIRNGELIEYKGDRIPVGPYPQIRPYTNHLINITNNDLIYQFSDGYADQFGGSFNKKLMAKRFKEILLEHHKLKMERQKYKLEEAFSKWRGLYDQIDDVLVMGYKFNAQP